MEAWSGLRGLTRVSSTFERKNENMFMGSLIFIGSGFLYWLLKPPVPQGNYLVKERISFPRNQTQNSEGVAGCLISQPSIR